LLGVALKMREVPASVEKRFLDQIGRSALGLQIGAEFLVGDQQ
jgi:hypothetical protein